jgi:uncharacterized protein YbjT (DUF2867 family)
MSKILITGANGTIGSATVEALLESKKEFKAAVRDVQKAKDKLNLDENQVVFFDFSKPETFETATKNVSAVFLIGPPLENALDSLLSPFIDFLKSKSILKVVYVSALKIDGLKELPFHQNLVDKLTRDGFELTVLKPSFFASNFKNYEFDNIVKRGITYVVAGEGKVGFIDPKDVGRVAAKVLSENGHAGKSYDLTGPELLSYLDAAQILSEVLGKPIFYPNPTAEEYTQALKAAGAPDFIAPYMNLVFSLIKNNEVAFLTDEVENLTGRKPETLKVVLQRDFA